VHPDYPDAHSHLAQLLAETARRVEAIPHWQRYLDFADTGPWAAAARGNLGDE
jgi:hypothetical protein